MVVDIANEVIDWLLAGDPAIRWQVMADLLDAPEEQAAAERERTLTAGWGADLLSRRQPDGHWADGACFPHTRAYAAEAAARLAAGDPPPPWPDIPGGDDPGQPWTATYPTLVDLRALGVPGDAPVLRSTADLVQRNVRWEYDGRPFFDGEVDCCINAGTILIGLWLGVDVAGVVARLLTDRMPDGGWNCWAGESDPPSTSSSIASTLEAITALLAWERAGHADDAVREARSAGEEYLLTRGLFRSRRTGEVVDTSWLQPSYPPRWHYDIGKALEYFRLRGGPADPRLDEAVAVLRAGADTDGRWPLGPTHPGAVHLRFEGPDGTPSRWVTLRALRVLRWYDAAR